MLRPARRRAYRLHILDWIALGLLAAGVVCVATGLLPAAEAEATVRRILPLLLFLASVIVLAELTAQAEVFDVIATGVAIVARGRVTALFLLSVLFASITTITLNLDTTAVLLTPVMLALARTIGLPAVPLAVTTVWLANTASLLLPVSNLTNLLAADRVALEPAAFAARLWLAQLGAIAVTMVFLWLFYWRRGRLGIDRYLVPGRHAPRDRALFWAAVAGCLLFIGGVVAGLPLGAVSAAAAGLVVIAFAVRERASLRPGLLPWRLLVFVTGLFLVVQTISRNGLGELTQALIGTGNGVEGTFRAALTGAGLSNVVNNLPAYVAGEAVVAVPNHEQLLGLLIGTNVGPIITPWASLATLLWYERCQAQSVEVPLGRLVATGAATAVVGVLVAVLGLLAS